MSQSEDEGEAPVKTVAGQHARIVPGEEAERLADLTGVQRDLRLVGDACRVIRVRRDAPAAAGVRRACFDSAVMRYRRCMRNSVRELIPTLLIDQLTTEERALHEQILDLADKSVAHCVDGSEENITYVLAGPIKDGKVPLELKVLTTTVSHHNIISMNKFEALVARLEKLARAESDSIAKSIMARLEGMKGSDILAFDQVVSAIKGGKALEKKYGGASRVRRPKKPDPT